MTAPEGFTMSNNGQYDDLNAHDIQAILDNAAGVVREVDAGSTAYTPEQYRHAQDMLSAS